MALLANLALFFVFYLPLTLAIGWSTDLYVGRYQSPQEEAPLFYWIIVGWPLLLPSILALPAAHLVLAVARRTARRSALRSGGDFAPRVLRRAAVAAIPLSFLAIHVWVWGVVVLSLPLLASILIPGALLGLVARVPRARRS